MSQARTFSTLQRIEIFGHSEGRCQSCDAEITLSNFHADHVIPWSRGGKTSLSNAQALCQPCNLAKSSKMTIPFQNHLPPGWALRSWQEEFIQRFFSSALQQISKTPAEIDAFILHAFPGSGKSLA